MAWMRRKSETQTPATETAGEVAHAGMSESKRERGMENAIVNIGKSVQIKGELTGNEDLTIEGMVDGKIIVKDHNLTIGPNGRITAEVHAKTVVVVGQVIGNITADDKVELAPTGSVQGDVRAPRVAISDGARFKGSIDMERKSAAAKPVASSSGLSSPAPHGLAQSAKASD